MMGHILSGYRVILHVIFPVLNPSVCLQLTHRSRKIQAHLHSSSIGSMWVWGEIREIERDAHNTNNSFEKTDFIVAVEKKTSNK